ncbi:carbonic anhydrase [Nitrosomonas sp. HPC101]|uniref:carbonic anhydrase family protein n=1 Tax=Nitrosomonas sp. HPC101 TaxID=1658667 RepID=UPI00137017DF|nr:carbonic anhydrase family protein [Nitrosomonas sp. HPC101]MXS85136.1 carbonic anhydrase [Nitrosomonas sp. HPC101]
MRTLTREIQAHLSPEQAIQLLKDGNQRFIGNLKLGRNLLQQVNETCEGQFPFAVILSCIDSRTSAELIFDQGLGDIFSCRIAGNILNEDILGSMEFACHIAGSKVIMILGHSKCGAVKGACHGVKLGNLTALLDKLSPAINTALSEKVGADTSDPAFMKEVGRLNVHHVMNEIPKRSQILAKMLANNEIALIGGMYDVDTGGVTFYDR